MAEERVMHGAGQQLKMELLSLIDSAADPFVIIYKMAQGLEEESGEPGFARYVENQLRAVYGFALGHRKLIAAEIDEVSRRLELIKSRRDTGDFTEEEKIRIGFAIDRHEKNLERLQLMLQKAEADGEEPVLTL